MRATSRSRTPRPTEAARRSAGDRAADLARLVPLWPAEIADTSPEGRARLVAKLYRALKAERRRGEAGHWTYDLARHAALLAAWRQERAALGFRDQATGPAKRKKAPAR